MDHTNKALAILALLVFLCTAGSAQNETAKWYFGQNAALDFMSSPPAPLSNSAMNAAEGSASMADAAGNLLFYTNYDIIYNSQHLPMANGTGLINSFSSTQSSIIVKQPGSSSNYYVFQQSGVGSGTNTGFHYSVVDMSLAGGLGAVTAKNVLLYQNNIWGITEKLSAARHCNGVDAWIIIHEMASNNFRSYLLTATGVNPVPVISAVGLAPATGACSSCWAGDMKVSPNGKKVGIVHTNLGVQVLDFDPATGLLSNPLTLSNSGDYSCEFSPDGTKFYHTAPQGAIRQWDLCAGSTAAILASQATITNSVMGLNGAMQLAPDGKIYVSVQIGFQSLSLGIINNPDLAGAACNYVYPAISIAPGLATWGLPNFMSDFFLPHPPLFNYTVNTALSCQTASFTAPPNIVVGGSGCTSSSFLYSGMTWNFGDPASGASNTSSQANPSHKFLAAGSYTVTLTLQRDCGADTLRKVLTIAPTVSISATGQPASCLAGGSATVTATGSNGPYYFLWSTGHTAPVLNNLGAGIYNVTLTDSGLCVTPATLSIALQNTMSGTVTAGSVVCPGGGTTGAATLVASGALHPYTYSWSGNPQNSSEITGLAPGLHTVSVSSPVSGCSLALTFQVAPAANATVLALPSLSVCEKGRAGLGTSLSGTSFHWTGPNGFSSSQQNTLLEPVTALMAGIYSLTTMDADHCISTSTLTLSVYPGPTVALSVSRNNLCAPYCTAVKADYSSPGAAISRTLFKVDDRILSSLPSEYCFTEPGQHLLSLSIEDANACKSAAQLYIQAYPKPRAGFDFSPLAPVAGVDEVLFTSTASGERLTSWYWFVTGDSKLAGRYKTASRTFENAGTQVMALVVQNAWGCADTVIKAIDVSEEFCFYMPDAFTPNDDGRNDLFQPKGLGIAALEMEIFDRWGERVFHSNDPKASWDGSFKGQPCKTDIYTWKAKIKSVNAQSKTLLGRVSLIR